MNNQNPDKNEKSPTVVEVIIDEYTFITSSLVHIFDRNSASFLFSCSFFNQPLLLKALTFVPSFTKSILEDINVTNYCKIEKQFIL